MKWSDQALDYVAAALASPNPTFEQVNRAQMNDFDRWIRYQHAYYHPYEARQAARLVGGEATGPFVLTDTLIGLHQLMNLGLLPVDAYAIRQMFFSYYWQRFGHLPRNVVALLDPTSRIGRGAIIHPSTRAAGYWQITAIDQDGPTSHTTTPDWKQAVLGCLDRGMHNPVTHQLDELVNHWIFPAVSAIK